MHFDFCAVSDERGSRAMVPRRGVRPSAPRGERESPRERTTTASHCAQQQSPKLTRAPTDPGQRDVPGACGFCAARVSSVRASACGARTARLAVRLLPLLTASTASLSLLLGELVNRVSVAQLERPVEDRLRQVGCVLDDAHRPSHRSTTNTQSGGRLRLSQDVRVRRRTMTLGLLRGKSAEAKRAAPTMMHLLPEWVC